MGVARAHAAAGNAGERDRYAALCEEALADPTDEHDLIASERAAVPGLAR